MTGQTYLFCRKIAKGGKFSLLCHEGPTVGGTVMLRQIGITKAEGRGWPLTGYSGVLPGSVKGSREEDFVSLPNLPEGAAALYFPGRKINEPSVVGASFAVQLGYEEVAYAYWLVTQDFY